MVQQTESINLSGYLVWKTPSLEFTISESTTVTLGVSVKGDAGAWGTIDDWRLEQMDHAVDEVLPESVKLNLKGVNILKKGNLLPLSAEILPKNINDKTTIWAIDNPKIVSIDENYGKRVIMTRSKVKK